MIWSEISGSTVGSSPSPRISFGFASADSFLYVYGGEDFDGSLYSSKNLNI